jgi:hypothetical protein
LDWGAIVSLVLAIFLFIVFPLVGIDVEAIIKDARKRAYEWGLHDE